MRFILLLILILLLLHLDLAKLPRVLLAFGPELCLSITFCRNSFGLSVVQDGQARHEAAHEAKHETDRNAFAAGNETPASSLGLLRCGHGS